VGEPAGLPLISARATAGVQKCNIWVGHLWCAMIDNALAPHADFMKRRRTIYLLTESNGFFGQRLMPWESMDVDRLEQLLSADFEVRRLTWYDVANGKAQPKGAVIVHSSSQQPAYKAFIDDVLLYLDASDNTLVPSIHTTRSHENKGYQELHKKLLNITSPKAIYAAKDEEVDWADLQYPAIMKDTTGFGSTGVRLVNSRAEVLRHLAVVREPLTYRGTGKYVRKQLGFWFRKLVLRRKNLRPYGNYYDPLAPFVLQSFVADLTFDFKVLAFQDRMFVLKRAVRKDDFRASGSGRFEFVEVPDSLLGFAEELLRSFREPYMAFDICFDGSDYHLIEFQGVHFGPYTLMKSPFHYVRKLEVWELTRESVTLEHAVAESIKSYLKAERDAD
jgi:hypothetical protein